MSFLHSRARSAPEGIGKPVRRTEDARLLTGKGCYSDDFTLPGQAYACLVRSPHAHARIRGIDTAPALAAPGVIAVLTGAHAAADGLRPIPHRPNTSTSGIAVETTGKPAARYSRAFRGFAFSVTSLIGNGITATSNRLQ